MRKWPGVNLQIESLPRTRVPTNNMSFRVTSDGGGCKKIVTPCTRKVGGIEWKSGWKCMILRVNLSCSSAKVLDRLVFDMPSVRRDFKVRHVSGPGFGRVSRGPGLSGKCCSQILSAIRQLSNDQIASKDTDYLSQALGGEVDYGLAGLKWTETFKFFFVSSLSIWPMLIRECVTFGISSTSYGVGLRYFCCHRMSFLKKCALSAAIFEDCLR